MWKFVIPIPVYGPRSKHAGQVIPLISGNLHVPHMVRSSRTEKHRRAAREAALGVREMLGVPEIGQWHRTVVMTLVRGPRQRILDIHQVYAGTKPYLDGLTDARWLVDDKPSWCSFSADQIKDNRIGPAVIVRIWDTPNVASS